MQDITTPAGPRKEGPVAKAIERQTSKLPSDLFLWAGLGAMGAGFAMQAMNRNRETGHVLAQMGPALLLLGVYNKIVKVAGSGSAESAGFGGRTSFGQ